MCLSPQYYEMSYGLNIEMHKQVRCDFYPSRRAEVNVFLCPPRRLVCVWVTCCRDDFSSCEVIGTEKGGARFIFESMPGATLPLKYSLRVSSTDWPLIFTVRLVLTEQNGMRFIHQLKITDNGIQRRREKKKTRQLRQENQLSCFLPFICPVMSPTSATNGLNTELLIQISWHNTHMTHVYK